MFTGARFLEIAESLSQVEDEAWTRTTIRRMYYGVYLEYRQHCESHHVWRVNIAL